MLKINGILLSFSGQIVFVRFLDHEIKFALNLYNLTLKEDFSLHFNNSNHFEPSLVDIGQVVRKKEVKNYLKSLRTGGWTERRRTKKKRNK